MIDVGFTNELRTIRFSKVKAMNWLVPFSVEKYNCQEWLLWIGVASHLQQAA